MKIDIGGSIYDVKVLEGQEEKLEEIAKQLNKRIAERELKYSSNILGSIKLRETALVYIALELELRLLDLESRLELHGSWLRQLMDMRESIEACLERDSQGV